MAENKATTSTLAEAKKKMAKRSFAAEDPCGVPSGKPLHCFPESVCPEVTVCIIELFDLDKYSQSVFDFGRFLGKCTTR